MTARTRTRIRGRLFGKILLAVFSAVFVLGACETALRLAWTNPYTLERAGPHRFRLHRPSLHATVTARDLYAGGGEVRFATGSDRAVGSGREDFSSAAIALGGSTTESALVPEGGRWPDLVAGGARNFGVSGNTLIDSYRNLRWLVDSGEAAIETVFLTHAINDLRALLSEGPDRFTVDAWSPAPVDLFSIDNPGQRVAFGLSIRDSWLLSALRFADREIRGRIIFNAYSHNRDSQALSLIHI